MATDDLRVADRAHQPKFFIFPRRSFGTKGRKQAFIQYGLINGLGRIIMKQMITLFVFTAHVRID